MIVVSRIFIQCLFGEKYQILYCQISFYILLSYINLVRQNLLLHEQGSLDKIFPVCLIMHLGDWPCSQAGWIKI